MRKRETPTPPAEVDRLPVFAAAGAIEDRATILAGREAEARRQTASLHAEIVAGKAQSRAASIDYIVKLSGAHALRAALRTERLFLESLLRIMPSPRSKRQILEMESWRNRIAQGEDTEQEAGR